MDKLRSSNTSTSVRYLERVFYSEVQPKAYGFFKKRACILATLLHAEPGASTLLQVTFDPHAVLTQSSK